MAYTTINKSTEHFNTLIYTGNGSSPRNITGVGFQPDWLWIKNRSITQSNFLFDAVRGVSKAIFSDTNGAESTQAATQTAFLSDGFTVGNDVASNGNGNSIASWNWKAGGGQGSSNTDGSINTTYTSVNTTAGFSISTYTGNGTNNATIGHGLGAVPKMMIFKILSSADDWTVYHASLGATKKLNLNNTDAESTVPEIFNSTAPTSSLITFGTHSRTNSNNGNYVCYAFAEKQGFSKFGSYVGNGNADGAFVYTGFKPAFVMIKLSSAADDWQIFDTKRNTFNIMDKYLRPNNVGGTVTNAVIDFVSNGFKLRSTAGSFNPSGGTAIYMAFAEAPLVGTNNVPCTAR